jgi:Cu+-exporting ATPase
MLDKTGTLTRGEPKVTNVIAVDSFTEQEVLRLAASAERGSEHPLAEAIVKAARQKKLELSPAEEFNVIPGRGVEAAIAGKKLLLGNLRLIEDRGLVLNGMEKEAGRLWARGKTVMFLGVDGQVAGIIALADTIKPGAREALRRIHDMGLEMVIVTGDNRRTAEAIARQLGIDRVLSEVLPEDKAGEVRKMQQAGRVVAMVGDGINDAPALHGGHRHRHPAPAPDIAMETGDITLIRATLTASPAPFPQPADDAHHQAEPVSGLSPITAC